MGLIYGILSGFGYALYSIFGKVASKCYPSKTVIFYTFLFALIGILPFCRAPELVTLLRDGEGMLYSFGMALVVIGLAFYEKSGKKKLTDRQL